MGKYRHKVTGRVVELPDDYARAIRAFEPVDNDAEVSDTPCLPCGPDESIGVDDSAPTAEEPFYSEEEGE